MDINEHLATEVRGWKKHEGTGNAYGPLLDAHWSPNGPRLADWNPTENIKQAFECLETFTHWSINHTNKGYESMIITDKKAFGDHIEVNESLPLAICLTCAKATGWDGE